MRARAWSAVVVGGVLVAGTALSYQPRAGADTAPAAQPAEKASKTEEDARRITPAELAPMLESGKAILVDVRAKEAYALSHAEGAISIPLAELDARLNELPKDKLIAAYCT